MLGQQRRQHCRRGRRSPLQRSLQKSFPLEVQQAFALSRSGSCKLMLLSTMASTSSSHIHAKCADKKKKGLFKSLKKSFSSKKRPAHAATSNADLDGASFASSIPGTYRKAMSEAHHCLHPM